MSDNLMSRRKFLAGAGAVAGAAGLASLGLGQVLERPAQAAGAAIPWPYPLASADQPNPEAVARRSCTRSTMPDVVARRL